MKMEIMEEVEMFIREFHAQPAQIKWGNGWISRESYEKRMKKMQEPATNKQKGYIKHLCEDLGGHTGELIQSPSWNDMLNWTKQKAGEEISYLQKAIKEEIEREIEQREWDRADHEWELEQERLSCDL